MLVYTDSTIEYMFYCVPAWSKTLFFWQQFLRHDLESVENNSEHDLAGMADLADSTFLLPFFSLPFLFLVVCFVLVTV